MILSIDVALLNLGVNIMSCTDSTDLSTYTIHLWNVYNTLGTDIKFCKSLQKNGNVCGKRCTYSNSDSFTCKTHKTMGSLVIVIKKIKDYTYHEIAKCVVTKLQQIYTENIEIFDLIKSIRIELQPSFNPKMKFVSHVIYAKLVDIYIHKTIHISFVCASLKLKAYTGPEIECNLKGLYAQRKWLSIQYTKWFLENKFNQEQKNIWLPFLESYKGIADDLCDTALMGINANHSFNDNLIKKKIKNEIKKKNKPRKKKNYLIVSEEEELELNTISAKEF